MATPLFTAAEGAVLESPACFLRLVVVVGERRLAIAVCTRNTLCVCSPSSFVRVGIGNLLLKGQPLFIALQKRAYFIAEIVGFFLNIVNISRFCDLFKCL